VLPPSSTGKTIDVPSHAGWPSGGSCPQFRSSSAVRTVASPDAGSTTVICSWRGKSNPPGRAAHAISEPSGDARGQALGLAARGVDGVDVDAQLDVPALVPRRREGEAVTTRRPGDVVVLEVAVRHLACRLRTVCRDDEDVLPAVARPADVVELERESREAARCAPALVLLLVGRVAHARDEREPRAVRRPGGAGDILVEVGQPERLAARDREHVQLLVRAVAVRDEREARPVWRPARLRVDPRAGGEAARRLRAVECGEPDRAAVLVRLGVDPVLDDGRRPPVGRDARLARPPQAVHLLGKHEPETLQ
jgi:hypothetical protein